MIDVHEMKGYIKERMADNDSFVKEEVGIVTSVSDGIAIAYGLNDAFYSELVEFETGERGMCLSLDHDVTGIIIFGSGKGIKEGSMVKRTNQEVAVPVGDELLGRVVNPIGEAIDGKEPIETSNHRAIERIAPGVMTRESVSEPLETGIKAIDTVIPIGKGQRELIIGDRQTGKTQIAVDTIINQKGKNVKCIYVAIAQKQSTVANIVSKLEKNGAMEYTTIVSATASQSAPLQYIAPYSGCAIGEEWMERGEDVLIIYDDLSKHAIAYRTLSLLLRKPPGREAYPGDVFYLHSRLLERAAKLNDNYGGGSLTALPMIETQAGDISAYIPTNVISITDGQIFLMSEMFNAGQRPAIDASLSVSRVGSAAQHKIIKELSGSIKLELSQYRELEAFTKFGSDLDEATQAVLKRGRILLEILKQPAYDPLTIAEEAIILYAAKNNMLDDLEINAIKRFEEELFSTLNGKELELINLINKELALTPEIDAELKRVITSVLGHFR